MWRIEGVENVLLFLSGFNNSTLILDFGHDVVNTIIQSLIVLLGLFVSQISIRGDDTLMGDNFNMIMIS